MICKRPANRAAVAGAALLFLCKMAGAAEPDAWPATPNSGEMDHAMSSIAPGRPFAGAEALFHADPRWQGSDAALSIPLSADRTLWLFGDTFVNPSGVPARSLGSMVRNSIAIQTGLDSRTAAMTFHWGTSSDGKPASLFPERGARWYWPGHGIRLEEGPLVIFLYGFLPDPAAPLGFAFDGYAIAVVDNPDAPPESWQPRIRECTPSPFDAVPATAVVRDGRYVTALAIRQKDIHAGALVRYAAQALAQGDPSGAEWWLGEERGWVPEADIGQAGPVFVMDDAGAECSLHWDSHARAFIHVASYGYGASTIGIRRAPALIGPWSAPETVYRPPESDREKAFVYAAKAHPEIPGPESNDLVITYATNSTDFNDVTAAEGFANLYWPRVICVPMGR